MSTVHSDGLGELEQDSSTSHTFRIVTEWLQEHSSEYRHFRWPPNSPGMNIIEYIWDALQRVVQKRSPLPLTPTDLCCQVIYSQFGLAIHQNDHLERRRFVEWAQNEIAVVPDFHKRILFSDEAHFWLNGYVNKQNCRIWSEANPQVYVETPLHPEKLTVWCALWAGGILLQKR
ncbi:transposable element tcb2 transposase [Trichonephila clavipes]|uniref:Transposable element tcb2 transposase n=1 Tax=Trichonephila clavipes TaxID=2585209 RepID=A0A8X6V212_TRICX|nr:transposable element tcb2 transposase [Trichonephila clavipes]